MKARLNNRMREDMCFALIAHGFDKRIEALEVEGTGLRNEAIHMALKPKVVAACKVIAEQAGSDALRWGNVIYARGVSVNCAGPNISVGAIVSGNRTYGYIEDAIPLVKGIDDIRVDLDADSEFGKRVMDWADRCETTRSERGTTTSQVSAALAGISNTDILQSAWPDAMSILQPIIEEHIGRPAPSLPAVVIGEMNRMLDLPPSNDGTLELTEIAA